MWSKALLLPLLGLLVACGDAGAQSAGSDPNGAAQAPATGAPNSTSNANGGSSGADNQGPSQGQGGSQGGSGSGSGNNAQPAAACPAIPLTTSFASLISNITTDITKVAGANTNVMAVPSDADRDAFAAQVLVALTFDGSVKCPLPASYGVFSLTDNGDDVRFVAELDKAGAPAPQLFWGSYGSRRAKTGTRALVIEAPHPLADTGTESESALVFSNARAEWYLLAGTHRCANVDASGCDGSTTACGDSSPYREADAAHSTKTPFWAIHNALSQANQDPFLQLHGNDESCPDALVADGSGTFDNTSLAGKIASALETSGTNVGRCGSGYPTSTCNLCAMDNVEGRATAGSSVACTEMGAAYERFVHIEQQPGLRASNQPILDAVNAVFAAR